MALRGARRVGATRTRAGPMPARRATAVARETDTARSEDLATTTGRGVLEEKRQVLARTEAATAPVFDGTLRFHVRPAGNLSEVYQVASLRAECYYEDRPFTRFVSNFKNEYARAEFRRLKAQSAATCLVCVDLENSSGDGNVIGSIDVTELALVKSKVHVPGREELVAGQEDSAFNSYVSNFCIRKDCRRLGLGSMLLASASRVHPAQEGLLAHNLYAHVNWDNSGARSFYQKHGFNRVTVLQEMELIHFQVDCSSGVSEA